MQLVADSERLPGARVRFNEVSASTARAPKTTGALPLLVMVTVCAADCVATACDGEVDQGCRRQRKGRLREILRGEQGDRPQPAAIGRRAQHAAATIAGQHAGGSGERGDRCIGQAPCPSGSSS